MSPADFEFFAGFLKARAGITLGADKTTLVQNRLDPVAHRHRLKNAASLVAKLRAGASETLAQAAIEAMTTNESSFFRDVMPFEQFRKVMLPALLQARAATRHIRIWCAAVSMGQEAYSLAMILEEMKPRFSGWSVDIIASDIHGKMIERAEEGLYDHFEVQRGLPIPLLIKYFRKEGESWRAIEAIRDRIRFRTFNLLDSPAGLGQFDVILCRNVLIYFDQRTKQNVLAGLSACLAGDGYLVLGAAESMLGLTSAFEPRQSARGLFVKSRAGAPRRAVLATG